MSLPGPHSPPTPQPLHALTRALKHVLSAKRERRVFHCTRLRFTTLVSTSANLCACSFADSCDTMDPGVPRLGVPQHEWLVETNSMVASACNGAQCATLFPSAATMGATFNRSLWRAKGATIGVEMRAMNNMGWHRGENPAFTRIGLSGFGACVRCACVRCACLRRDSRWVRAAATPLPCPAHRCFRVLRASRHTPQGLTSTSRATPATAVRGNSFRRTLCSLASTPSSTSAAAKRARTRRAC